MLYHASIMRLIAAPAPFLISSGWMGVDLFFVLSGYLIASQLLRPLMQGQAPNYQRFFSRRLLRTLPAYTGLIESLIVMADARSPGSWFLLDGHLRLEATPRCGPVFDNRWATYL